MNRIISLPMVAALLLTAVACGSNTKKTDGNMEKISFARDTLTLVGNLYKPEGFREKDKYTALIIQGSMTSVKEQMPALYAGKLSAEGFVCLAFDYSHYGESEGEPRQLENPEEKVADIKAATSYLLSQPYVEKVAIVGICTSAQSAVLAASEDKRIAALATVAGFLATPDALKAMLGEETLQKRMSVEESTLIAAYSETDPTAANYRPTPGAYDYYLNPRRGNVPTYRNQLNTLSFKYMYLPDPIAAASDISVPAIIVHSDGCALPGQAKAFYEVLASQKKEYADGGGSHFDYYDKPEQVDFAVSRIAGFFRENL